jgi:GT2 family glycosyltransferase
MAAPYLSVIVPTYQRRNSVARLLRALAQQTLSPDRYEVIISIDGSRDGTLEMVEAFTAPYQLSQVWQPNTGRAAACNAGMRLANGEVLVFFDDDMEPAPDCLENHSRAHCVGERLAAIGAAPIHVDATTPSLVKFVATGFNSRLEKFAQPSYAMKFNEAYTGNFSIRRSLMDSIGGFDEDFKAYGYEDYELALRLSLAGARSVYAADALAHQHYTKDFAGMARDNIGRGKSAVLFAGKHPQVFGDLKLSRYDEEWRAWRPARAGLLCLSQWWPGAPDAVIAFVHWLERRNPARLHLYYDLALDYCYWLGVRMALRDNRRSRHGLITLKGMGQKPGAAATNT